MTPAPLAEQARIAQTRGLAVLSCSRSGDRSLSNQRIAWRCSLPKLTVTSMR
jgi:hypothetical protein